MVESPLKRKCQDGQVDQSCYGKEVSLLFHMVRGCGNGVHDVTGNKWDGGDGGGEVFKIKCSRHCRRMTLAKSGTSGNASIDVHCVLYEMCGFSRTNFDNPQ